MTASDRSGKRAGSAACAPDEERFQRARIGLAGSSTPCSPAERDDAVPALGRAHDAADARGSSCAARNRAVTPLAAIMKSSMISLGAVLLARRRDRGRSSPSKTGLASMVSRLSAPWTCRRSRRRWAIRS